MDLAVVVVGGPVVLGIVVGLGVVVDGVGEEVSRTVVDLALVVVGGTVVGLCVVKPVVGRADVVDSGKKKKKKKKKKYNHCSGVFYLNP